MQQLLLSANQRHDRETAHRAAAPAVSRLLDDRVTSTMRWWFPKWQWVKNHDARMVDSKNTCWNSHRSRRAMKQYMQKLLSTKETAHRVPAARLLDRVTTSTMQHWQRVQGWLIPRKYVEFHVFPRPGVVKRTCYTFRVSRSALAIDRALLIEQTSKADQGQRNICIILQQVIER